MLAQLAKEVGAYRSGARCDGCRHRLIPSDMIRHCDMCQYDLCESCWADQIPAPGYPMRHDPACVLQCPKGHFLRQVLLSQLANEVASYKANVVCDGCYRHISPSEVLYHCDSCQYDLCESCWANQMPAPGYPMRHDPASGQQCPKGHFLRQFLLSQLAEEVAPYRGGAVCDGCYRRINPSDVIYHCDRCRYDLCNSCWAIRTAVPGPMPPPPFPASVPVGVPVPEHKKTTEDDQGVSDDVCIVCMVEKRDHVFVPCGHMLLCSNCSSRYDISKGCPLCRSPCTTLMKVYR